MLKAMEASYGVEMVEKELERVYLLRGIPHNEETCRYCQIDNNGWVYCPDSRHHVDHPQHTCPVMQECSCQDSDQS